MHESKRLDALADNIANSSRPGYRRTVVSAKPFIGAMQDAIDKEHFEDGTQVDKIVKDFTPGNFRQTDRTLDFAIEGEGFFTVMKGNKPYYTRCGAFTLDPDGKLVTPDGYTVGGDITIPSNIRINNLTVGTDGTLYDGKTAIGTLEMVSFPDKQKLISAGPTLFMAPSNMAPETPAKDSRMLNKTLENSNTSMFAEMADMITCMRNFESCQKMLMIQDTLEGQMISRFAM